MPRRRSLRSLRNLPRSETLSQIRAAYERSGRTVSSDWPNLSLFAPDALLQWLEMYWKDSKVPNCKFVDASPTGSIYPLESDDPRGEVRISMAGDWGTGTDEAHRVANGMMTAHPHYTIHLGDIYYIGDKRSVEENVLGVQTSAYTPVKWPAGQQGSFALNGNHEMYAAGYGYFRTLLQNVGVIRNGTLIPQTTSFFCLENPHWRIIALDTGYYSRGTRLSNVLTFIASALHLRRADSWLQPRCHLPDRILQWLRDDVKLQDDRTRGLILLSHHQYYTLFGDNFDYTTPAKQLADLIQRPVLWFWGHEHRMAGYSLTGPGRIKAHGRCIGHGGMPVSRHAPPRDRGDRKLLFYDNRPYEDGAFGRNGYITLTFNGAQLIVRYYSLAQSSDGPDELLIEETWNADAGGAVSGSIATKVSDTDFYYRADPG